MKMNRGPRQPARDPVCLSAASGGRGSCFRSAARAYAARTRAYFSLVGKVGKSTPEPAALDSLAHRPEGDTLCFVLFCLRCDLEDWLFCGVPWAASGRSVCGYALLADIAAAPKAPASTIGARRYSAVLAVDADQFKKRRSSDPPPIDPVGSRRSPARQRRHWLRTKQGIVGGKNQHPRHSGASQGGPPP